jgi:DNA modification methylase
MGVRVTWKPVAWWVKERYGGGRVGADGWLIRKPDKSLDMWQQSVDWARLCLQFVREGGLVVDPLMGTGTVGVACVQSGYRFVGVEVDEGRFRVASERLAELVGG